jgi:hypothetical protein
MPEKSDDFLDSLSFRLGTKFLMGTTIVVLFLTLAQCTIKKPESPEWVTTLTVPLINRTYPMSELVWRMDQEGLEVNGDSIIFSITEEIDTVRLDQNEMSARSIDTSVSQYFGAIDIDPPTISPVTIAYSDISSLVVGVLPPVSFSIDNDMPPISNFSTAYISNGEMYVVVSNNLGVDLDTIDITLYDIANPAMPLMIASQSFLSGINNGSTDSILIDLDDKTISNSLRITVSCYTPGGVILSADGKSISTAVNFAGPFVIWSATNADAPAISLNDTTRIQLGEDGDTDIIQNATLTNGILQLTIINNTPVIGTLSITLPDLVDNSLPLSVQQILAPSDSQTVNIDLSTYELTPSDLTAPQEIEAIVTVLTVADRVDINQSQFFSVSVSLNGLTFDSITGIFATKGATIDPTTQEIDVPQGFEGFELSTAVLSLSIENAVQMPGSLNIHLVGSNGQQFDVAGLIAAGTSGSPVTSVIVNDQAAAFLTPFPEQIDITGTAIFGDGLTVSTITTNDFLHATVSIVAPLEMVITGATIETDVEEEDIDIEDIDIVTDHVEQISFIYTVSNSLPLGITANVYLSQSPNVSATVNDLDISGLSIPSAPFANGLSTGFSSSADTVLLSNDDIQVLNTDSLYILTAFVLEDTNGEAVRLIPDNSITITGRLEVQYLFDGNF